MPTKAKEVTEPVETADLTPKPSKPTKAEVDAARKLVLQADADAEAAKPLCGQVNAHWTGDTPMTCTLKRGHSGNHQAQYVNRTGSKEMASWSNAAGVPVEEIVPEPIVEA